MERGAATPGTVVWTLVQALGVVATTGLIAGLFLRPDAFLSLLWDVVIPLVPAALLVSPLLWRNACPLATLEMAAARLAGDRPPARRWATRGAAAGILLLAVLVPGRHVVFNTDGTALAWTIAGVALIAIGGGVAFDAKGGFCNTICPVLPVERLYGQSPFLEIGNARCSGCTGCAPACIDLGPRTAPLRALGDGRDGIWTLTAFGGFAAAFPGFVLGYFTTLDGGISTAPWIYAQIAAWCGIAWIATTAAVVTRGVRPQAALPLLAALAAGVYYGFAAPRLAEGIGWVEGGNALRAAFLALVAGWWIRAERLRRAGQGLRAA